MLKKLWRLIWGEPDPDKLMAMFEILMEKQDKTQAMVFRAVQSIGDASTKQAEVLSQYLKLFQTPGEPQHWTFDQDQEVANLEELEKSGFPKEGTEKEQAEWVLANLERL